VIIPDEHRDLILRAKEALDIGVSLGAFARSQGLSYKEICDILDLYEVRKEKRTILVLPGELLAA